MTLNMEQINTLMELRSKNGYTRKDYKRYLSFTKSMKNKSIFLSEYYLCKYFIFIENKRLSKKFIKKALRIKEDENTIYFLYLNGIYCGFLGETETAIEKFLTARKLGINNTEFIKEIDERIFQINKNYMPEKIKHVWNELTIEFYTQNEFDNFRHGIKNKEKDYRSQLINFIIDFEKLKTEMENYIEKAPNKFKNIFEKCKKLENHLAAFISFLDDNFLSCGFLNNHKNEVTEIKLFYEHLLRYANCEIELESEILKFRVGALYTKLENAIENSKQAKYISVKKAKALVEQKFKEKIDVQDNNIKMPFLPVYYDLAYDYIQYPKEDSKHLTKLLRGFSFFSKK